MCIYFFKSKIEKDKEKEVDRTPESLVYVEGVEAQALFNCLMNCKSSTAMTGPLAGVPPTLMAPVAFHGATLKSLKVCTTFDVYRNGKKFFTKEFFFVLLSGYSHCQALMNMFLFV